MNTSINLFKINNIFKISLFTVIFLSVMANNVTQAVTRIIKPFDADWSFKKDNLASGPEKANFDASSWKKIDLPHDWSIEDLPNQIADSIMGPFRKGDLGQSQNGYTVGETGWYRKEFVTEQSPSNKVVTLYFDGVYMNSNVWLNGHYLGNHPYGYTPFYYDLTPYLNPVGKTNILVVQVKNEGVNSRWYSGSGIYRHVNLIITNKVSIVPWGVYITTPEVSSTNASVKINTTVVNRLTISNEVSIVTTILSAKGAVVGNSKTTVSLTPNVPNTFEQNLSLTKPQLWSVEKPQLYTAVTEIKQGDKTIDQVNTTFGVRSLSFSTVKGFLLNGNRVILKGGCVHHDNGPLGAVAIDRAEVRKIEILKQNGFNAIRTSHNPPSQVFLDACDRLGMLVLDEAFDIWNQPKSPNDYSVYFKDKWNDDLTAMILRDRNHPSVILWSVGNEIPEKAKPQGLETRKMLVKRVHELDSSRLVTEAISRTPQWEQKTPAIYQDLDIGGYNYLIHKYESDHKKFPQRIMVGTETYANEVYENFTYAERNPYVIGDFVWTALDYIGETGLGNATYDKTKLFNHNLFWPYFNANCGVLDLVGDRKPAAFYRDVVWSRLPVAMSVHEPIPDGMQENISWFGWPNEMQSWTWPGAEGKPLQVRVFSKASMVRLLLNGQVVGEQKMIKDSITANFTVPYQPGVLKAVNIENGKETATFELKTSGAPAAIKLVADRNKIKADRNDLSYVNVEIVDTNGNLVPNAENIEVTFTISGNGEIAGTGNGNPVDLSSFQQPVKKVFHGKGLVIVRSKGESGEISLSATAKNLMVCSIKIKVL
jgi:Beta-galactosidase/beta-glucuronidase